MDFTQDLSSAIFYECVSNIYEKIIMPSTVKSAYFSSNKSNVSKKDRKKKDIQEIPIMSEDENLVVADDFDFVSHYGDSTEEQGDELLSENSADTAISCGFIGVGGAGGKMATAFIDIGFNKTLLVNTTEKDQPDNTDPDHFLLIPGADGVGKDINLGEKVLTENSALVEDALKNRIGSVDWLFILAGGGGGTGSAAASLHSSFERYMKSSGAGGSIVYILTSPSAQELLNPTIRSNYKQALSQVSVHSHIILDNERQLQLLRGKVGVLNMFPLANISFAKMLAQIFKLAGASSPIQAFDTKDLERCLRETGRLFLGTTVISDPSSTGLGSRIFQESIKNSPCPSPSGKPSVGSLLLCVSEEMASDPTISNHMESAVAYVGGRSDALFSGIYVRDGLPGLVAIVMLGGLN
jgi:cell division protein FtsZ